MTVRDPGDTYALLVGVDSCKISNDWSLRGPSLDAVRMASFLIGKELSPERMTVLLTIHPEDRDEVTAPVREIRHRAPGRVLGGTSSWRLVRSPTGGERR